ncbi:radical SAM family heme chaperone HemW [Maricaulis sp.]|uniref:radical SAM family heme chaperone HemW n=1 Tax=Maricaulis sp. TaxID=1486257 RepID=UPI00260274EB|nr:radical SAM family heme chaperone HemW [Maricaulis sp.]
MSEDTALGLYIHWPYCARICPYCDFNVYRPKGAEDVLRAAILDDMAHWRERTGARALTSLHFGGGTPSLMTPEAIGEVIEAADQLWGFTADAERGLEANPNDRAGFKAFAGAGINRLSVGVQSFQGGVLERLGRDHGADTARSAVDMALHSVPEVSLDLIYAWDGQTLEMWRQELDTALATGVGHLSPYQLTIEQGTAFGKRAERGEKLALEADDAAAFYELADEIASRAGFERYEISNHARSPAAQSRHNRLYWEGADWIGVGPGAHGRLGRHSTGGRIGTEAARRPGEYVQQVKSGRWGVAELEALSAEDERAERILMGIRLAEGLDLTRLQRATGLGIDEGEAERMIAAGLLQRQGDRIQLTREGQLLGDAVSMALVP